MRRVMIVGEAGAGKSWLASELGRLTGLPVIHVDKIHHLPGWQARPLEDKIAMALDAHDQPEWIFEGGLSATYDRRLSRADTLVVLDMPLALRAWRVLWRTLRWYGQTRPDMADGCPERFELEFWRWIWSRRKTGPARLHKLAALAGQDVDVVILSSPGQVRRWLSDVSAAQSPPVAT